ncbi:hypothetical protein O181_071778 [Austropuccinia psidii MF-1]|uniref:Major facilitator superfamily (MFS) profile domain-containing protein n=1 Tax=Austropuccinia psidii MF-1 TaxID=1389203 RepID=A0A9Q3F664_9BASI|nr:hypothetical protein [Austropuccinia psidii MF-1]
MSITKIAHCSVVEPIHQDFSHTPWTDQTSNTDLGQNFFVVSTPQAFANRLGTVRLEENGNFFLSPLPSSDPNDPLYWTKSFKFYILGLSSTILFFTTFITAGIVLTAQQLSDFFSVPNHKVAGLYIYPFLGNFLSLVFLTPLSTKYGRRPFYLSGLVILVVACVWASLARSYHSFLSARLLIGMGHGMFQSMVPLTIVDTFFVIERGFALSIYSAIFSGGAMSGVIVTAFSLHFISYKLTYLVVAIIYIIVLALVLLTFPETAFKRDATSRALAREKLVGLRRLRILNGCFVDENLARLILRPLGFMCFPSVTWSLLVFGCHNGALAAVNVITCRILVKPPYSFSTFQIGTLFIPSLLFVLLAMYISGPLCKHLLRCLTTRNKGIFEPEMRLPALLPTLIISPAAFFLYAAALEYKLHWAWISLALAIFQYSIVSSITIPLAYNLDILKPIAPEVIVATFTGKALITWSMGAHVIHTTQSDGPMKVFCALAAVSFVVLSPIVLFIFEGKKIRRAAIQWRILKWMLWSTDREDYEPVVESTIRNLG